jgi:transcriptional regulator with XRE-family HTH domain
MGTTTRKTVATNVRRLRKQRGWAQTDLANKSGVAQTTISSVERPEDKSPTLDTLSQLAEAFGIPPWTLLVDVDDLDPAHMRALDSLVRSFAKLPPAGQDQVSRVADAEARYAKAG